MNRVTIELAAPGDPRVVELIALQKAHAERHTPPDSGHALDVEAAASDDVRFWIAIENGAAVGCIALACRSADEGEIKTMHVREEHRNHGVASELVEHVIDEARASGFRRLVLETGRSEGFAASRRLYARFGFELCDRFGPYVRDPFSFCMARQI
ncbi:MAG: GNAT family N-acetyltransferase [Pseudomonadota bacterium]